MDDRLRKAMTRLHLAARYMDNPCPYCGHVWKSVDELSGDDIVAAKPGDDVVAAHAACFYASPDASEEWKQQHPQFAPGEGGGNR